MLPQTLRTRGVNFAFLFGPPRLIERPEASQIHSRICDEFKVDDFVFKYSPLQPAPKTTSRGFSVIIERQEGRGRFRVVIDHPGAPKPIRLLMEYQWPISPDIDAKERFDMAAKAVFEGLKEPPHRVLAETRIRAQCEAAGGDARAFLSNHLLNLQGNRAAALGAPVTFASFTLQAAPREHTNDPLADPIREVTVEVLREDSKSIYVDFAARWTQAPLGARGMEAVILRPIDQSPSGYVDATHENLRLWVESLAT